MPVAPRRSAAALWRRGAPHPVAACSSSGSSSRPATTVGPRPLRPTRTRPDHHRRRGGPCRHDRCRHGPPASKTLASGAPTSRWSTPAAARRSIGATKAPAKDGRTLPTVILYPTDTRATTGKPPATPSLRAVPTRRVLTRGDRLGAGVRRGGRDARGKGYVVALPTFPLTSGPGGWSNLTQVLQQPGDVSFIITKLLAESKRRQGPAGRPPRPERGGRGRALARCDHLVVLREFLLPRPSHQGGRCGERNALSGPSKSDTFVNQPSSPPLLMLHGKKDTTLPYEGGSASIFTTLTRCPGRWSRSPTRATSTFSSAPPSCRR